jgi:protein SCO1/2
VKRNRLLLLAALALARPSLGAGPPGGTPAQSRPPMLNDVGFDQKLGQSVPLDIELKDESGRPVRLGDFFGKRPVVMALVYYECPMLCTLTLNGLTSALGVLSLDAAKDFEIVTVSFEPKETPELAAAKKRAYLQRYGRPGAESGWHFLTGEKPAIDRLTKAVGFRYAWEPRTNQYAHPSGIIVATPEGKLSHYLFGIEYAPKDLRLALVEASQYRIGTAVDQVLLYCYQYDPATGRYGAAVMRLLRAASVLTLVGLFSLIGVMLHRERAAAARQRSA